MYKYSLTPAPLPITHPHCSQQIKRQNMSKNSFVICPVFPLLFASIIQIGEPHTRAGGLGYQDPPCIGNRTVILEVLYIHVFYILEALKSCLKKFFGWHLSDIATECEEHLGPAGYCALQLLPVNELKKQNHPDAFR